MVLFEIYWKFKGHFWTNGAFLLDFDSVEEILKLRFHIYILIKKVFVLRKIHVEMKSFALYSSP